MRWSCALPCMLGPYLSHSQCHHSHQWLRRLCPWDQLLDMKSAIPSHNVIFKSITAPHEVARLFAVVEVVLFWISLCTDFAQARDFDMFTWVILLSPDHVILGKSLIWWILLIAEIDWTLWFFTCSPRAACDRVACHFWSTARMYCFKWISLCNEKHMAKIIKVGCKPQLEARMTITSTMTILFYLGQKSQQVRYEKFCVICTSYLYQWLMLPLPLHRPWIA